MGWNLIEVLSKTFPWELIGHLLAMTLFDPIWHMQVEYMIVSNAPKWAPNGMKFDECLFYDLCLSFELLCASPCSTLIYLTHASKICDYVI